MFVYDSSGHVVVVDRSGKKVRQRAPLDVRRSFTAAQNAANGNGNNNNNGTAAPSQPIASNPLDGYYYCSIEPTGLQSCNRAYMSAEELATHIQKRHTPGGVGDVSVANPLHNPAIGAGMGAAGAGMGAAPPVQPTIVDNNNTSIFKCPEPGCPKGYWNNEDLQVSCFCFWLLFCLLTLVLNTYTRHILLFDINLARRS